MHSPLVMEILRTRPKMYVPRIWGSTASGNRLPLDLGDSSRTWNAFNSPPSAPHASNGPRYPPGDSTYDAGFFNGGTSDGHDHFWCSGESGFWGGSNTGYTWLCWFRSGAGSSNWKQFFARHNDDLNQAHFQFRLNPDGRIELITFTSGGTPVTTVGTTVLTDDWWHACWATWYEFGSGVARIYVDDLPVEGTSSTHTLQTPDVTEGISLGARRTEVGSEPMFGHISHAAFWVGRALTAGDRARVYQAGMRRVHASRARLR